MKTKKIYSNLAIALIAVIAMTSCSNLDESTAYIAPTNTSGVILSTTFSSDMGEFTQYSVSGDQIWTYSSKYLCMVMTGYVSPTNYANEDWLISPEIDLSSALTANVSFEHAGSYFNAPATDVTCWVSDNYTDGNPESASWTQLAIPFSFSNASDFTFINSGQMSLTAFSGKKVRVALKYLSTSTKAGTWEVKNFLVQSGEAVVADNGLGTKESPYTVTGAGMHQTAANAWVKGYIVGYVWYTNSMNQFFFSADTCTQATNVLIADSLSDIYLSKCVAVQLPAGAVRTGLNLNDIKANYGKHVTLYGSLSNYFGMSGLKNTSYYMFDDGTSGGSKPIDAIFSETFSTSLGAFTKKDVSGAQTWYWSSGYGATMSGFANSKSNANEDWLISPTINLTGKTTAALTFDHTINKGVVANMQTNHTLWMSADDGTTWEQVAITTYPAGNNWTFVNSGVIAVPAKFLGVSTFKFAFKYLCSDTESASWEIKNVLVY